MRVCVNTTSTVEDNECMRVLKAPYLPVCPTATTTSMGERFRDLERSQPHESLTTWRRRLWNSLKAGIIFSCFIWFIVLRSELHVERTAAIPANVAAAVARCKNLNLQPGPPTNFFARNASDRFVMGTKPTLIKNATIWTGELNGTRIVQGDLFFSNGIIKNVGGENSDVLSQIGEIHVVNAHGAWITPG